MDVTESTPVTKRNKPEESPTLRPIVETPNENDTESVASPSSSSKNSSSPSVPATNLLATPQHYAIFGEDNHWILTTFKKTIAPALYQLEDVGDGNHKCKYYI